jgi:hypothetical protein
VIDVQGFVATVVVKVLRTHVPVRAIARIIVATAVAPAPSPSALVPANVPTAAETAVAQAPRLVLVVLQIAAVEEEQSVSMGRASCAVIVCAM